MNINRCSRFKLHGKYCAFLKMSLNKKDGKVDEYSASCGLKISPTDEYRMIPEHSEDGNVLYQRGFSSDPFPVGPNVIWESLSQHDTGMSFSPRRIREDQDMHPLYSIKDINDPTAADISENTILTPFGKGVQTCLSPLGWKEQEIKGLDRIVKCYSGLHGDYNKAAGIVVPPCIKDYCGVIPHWKNYTVIPAVDPKRWKLILVDSNKSQIVEHCIKWFGSTRLAFVIAEIMIGIKRGEFIPLREALINNGVHKTVIRNFMDETNIRSKPKSEVNLEKYYLYYNFLKNDIPKDKSFVYIANLVNYILNDTKLEEMDPNVPDSVLKDGTAIFSTSRRYWWVIMIIKDILKNEKKKGGRKIIDDAKLPPFLFKLIDAFLEKPKKRAEKEKRPVVISFKDIVKGIHPCSEDKRKFGRKARIFSRILVAGKRWTKAEIRAAWENFCYAEDGKNPERFWAWVETVKMANGEQTMGLLVDNVEIAPEKAFAEHLMLAMKSRHTFEVTEPHLYGRWMQANPRGTNLFREDSSTPTDPRDIFYREYQRISVKSGKLGALAWEKVREELARLNPETAEMIISDYKNDSASSPVYGTVVDREDIGVFGAGKVRVVNIDRADAVVPKTSDTDSIEFDDAEPGDHFDVDSAEASVFENTEQDQQDNNTEGSKPCQE